MSWPRRQHARLRYLYSVVRTGGLLWLALQATRRFRTVPFTLIDGLYYRICRAVNLARLESYSTAVIYGSDGGTAALRDFLIDMERRHREDPELLRTGRLEVAIAGSRIESGAFFSLSLLFPTVQDVHVYGSREQLLAELPFFVPAPLRLEKDPSNWIIDLEDYPASRALQRFREGRPIDVSIPQLTNWKATRPLVYALLRSQSIVVVNLPSPDRTYDGMRERWADFFTLVQKMERPQVFLVVSSAQPAIRPDGAGSGLTVFYASQLGMDLVDCLALVRQVDGYVGAFDEFGLMTVGTGIPALLVQPDARPRSLPLPAPRSLCSKTGQVLYLDPPTGQQVFESYRKLISDPRA